MDNKAKLIIAFLAGALTASAIAIVIAINEYDKEEKWDDRDFYGCLD